MRNSIRRKNAVLGVVAIATLSGFGLELAGFAPWVAIATAACALVMAFAQRFGWTLSIALSVSGMLAGFAILLRLTYFIPVAMEYQVSVVILAVSVVSWIGLHLMKAPFRLPPLLGVVPLVPAVLLLVSMIVAVEVTDGTRVSWAMQNDAVWNTMTGRFVLRDHGVNWAYANAAPMTPALIAAAMAAGRAALEPSAWMQHDITRTAELWLLLMLASSLLAGALAFSTLLRLPRILRAACSLAISLIPLSSFMAGNAIQFGFYNATISLVLLLCAWLAWRAANSYPVASFVALMLTAVAILATWAPLVLVPVSLALVVLLRGRSVWWGRLRGRRLVALVAGAILALGYLVAFTLPDLIRESGSLSADGGIFAIGPKQVALMGILTIAATLVVAIVLKRWWDFVGASVVVVSGSLALGYLLFQRRSLDLVWGYYPAKFGWLIGVLLIIVTATAIFSLGERTASRRRIITTAIAGSVASFALISYPAPSGGSLVGAWSTLVPALGGSGGLTTDLFALSDPREKNLVSGSADDLFINGWLLQQQAVGPHDPLRGFAYGLVANDVDQLCDVARVWGAGIVVHSSDPALNGRLSAACPAAGITAIAG